VAAQALYVDSLAKEKVFLRPLLLAKAASHSLHAFSSSLLLSHPLSTGDGFGRFF
jgi:hypothetical protein